MTPEQFWRTHPRDYWLLLEANRPPKMFGKMTEDEVRQIYEEDHG
jgi:hypothetical protein